jgi:hypothetical protein
VQTSLLRGSRRVRALSRQGSLGLNLVTFPGVARGAYTMEIKASATVDNNNAEEGGTLTLNKRYAAPLKVRK